MDKVSTFTIALNRKIMNTYNTNRKTLKKFGITMFIALSVIGTLLFLRGKSIFFWFYLAGFLFLSLGLISPQILKPVYKTWMKFAFMLGLVNTRLILSILFYLIFTPISFVMKICRVDMLDRKIDKKRDSYWRRKEVKGFNPSDYERQF